MVERIVSMRCGLRLGGERRWSAWAGSGTRRDGAGRIGRRTARREVGE